MSGSGSVYVDVDGNDNGGNGNGGNSNGVNSNGASVNGNGGTAVPREQRALPILQTMAPRVSEPSNAGSRGAQRRVEQPLYVPAPIESRPHAAEIAHWMDVLEATPLLELGARADALRQAKHPEGVVSYIVDRNINYTNVCITDCRFCAFYRRPKDGEAYVLSYEEVGAKIDEAKAVGAVQILMQGGHNPYLPLDWYVGLLRYIKEHHPIHVHGFSASEVETIAKVSKLGVDEVLEQLHDAGLDSMPGAGAEVLVDAVRDFIAPKKIDSARWVEVHEAAHAAGMHTTATMMYGVGETWEDRLEHLLKLRASQERSLARGRGHYTAFITWSFQPSLTEMQDWDIDLGTGMDYLKMTALARLVLDNFENVQVSYVTQGPKMAQIALRFGANDFGSLMIEENVVSATGIDFIMPEHEICRIIENAGFTPARRYQDYTLAREDDGGCPCCRREHEPRELTIA
ncbi:MAG TPA: cyclic dehypoxanthinyl futalosine synthase [Longimicrobiales bacterium]|nr:cyclic dehypoxanthinyl futalosine synthase [Longimicrobiales bacterium]